MKYNYNDMPAANIVGSFFMDRNEDFNNGLTALNERFKASYGIDAVEDILRICKDDVLSEQYKELLLGDVLDEQFEDPYLNLLPSKVEQLYENSRSVIINESYGVAQLSPVVGYTLPIVKKNMLECIAKDIMMTVVPDKPIVKVQFERKFLKDDKGNKYYIPEIFYDSSYKAASMKAKGHPVYAEAISAPLEDYDLMTASLGAGNVRKGLDKFDHSLAIVEVKFADADEPITGLNIMPDIERDGLIYKELPLADGGKKVIVGRVDYYNGTVSCASMCGKLEHVKFNGHVSNQYNDRSLDIDVERENVTWKIEEQEKINSALTIERIKDMKAMANIDVTPEVVNDIATILTQFEDSSALDFLDNSLNVWKDKKDLPFGYTDGFVETAVFNCNVESGMLTQSDYIEKELKFRFNKLLSSLKDKLKTEELMFVAFGHPENLELFNSSVKWVVDEATKVGGLQLDYRFGVMTETGTRVHFVSSMKVDKKKGIHVVAYPTTENHITFKHYKYSFNIENTYHHPLVPRVPNIMGTQRYKTTEMLPLQAQMTFINNDFGIASRK